MNVDADENIGGRYGWTDTASAVSMAWPATRARVTRMDGAEGTSENAALAPTEATVTATDDDMPAVRPWATAIGVPESGSGTNGVGLNTQPSDAVTVRLAMIWARACELLRREEVGERFGVWRSWIHFEMEAGRFPQSVRIGK